MSAEMKLAFQRIRRELAAVKGAANAAMIYIDDVVSRLDSEPEQSSRGVGREWEICMDAIEIDPGKFASRTVNIAVSCFEAHEIVLVARAVLGASDISAVDAFDDVRIHQVLVDDVVQKRVVNRAKPTDSTRPWRIAINKMRPSYRTVTVTLHNKGKEKRLIDVVFKGVAKMPGQL